MQYVYLCVVKLSDVEALRVLSISSFLVKDRERFYLISDMLLHVAA